MAEPTLVGANITFHTNDEDKDDDTLVTVTVQNSTMTTVAAEIADNFGHFDDNSDGGPFELLLVNPLTRDELKIGNMKIAIKPNGHDTWRFNFFLDLRFSDGSHLLARANHLQLTQTYRELFFGIE